MENNKIVRKFLLTVVLHIFSVGAWAYESTMEKYLDWNLCARRYLLLDVQRGNIVCFLIAIVCITILWWQKIRLGKERKNSLTYIYSCTEITYCIIVIAS